MKKKCPDTQILSVYLDNELPSPWKEKMEAHLEQCSECRGKLAAFRQLQNRFLEKQMPAGYDSSNLNPIIEAAQNKVWQNLQAGQNLHRETSILSKSINRKKIAGLWRRKFSVSLPAAAAAAVILILLTTLWVRKGPDDTNGYVSQPQESARENFIVAAEDEMPDIIPAMDMNSVLQYLGSDGSDIIILRLPESKNFFRSGEPAIIRAADYTRR